MYLCPTARTETARADGETLQPHHHAVRYARLLDSLLRTFSRGQDGVDTSSPQDHLNQPSSVKPEPTPAAASLMPGDSPWPVSRPPSPNMGSMNTASNSQTPLPSTGLPMSFWGGGPVQAGNSGPPAFQPMQGDYRNFNDMSMPAFSSSFGNQNQQQGGQQVGNGGYAGSTSYMQLANQNLAGAPGFSPHSDSMVLPMEAYTNLLDDTTLDFWTALTNSQDWGAPAETQMGGTIFPSF